MQQVSLSDCAAVETPPNQPRVALLHAAVDAFDESGTAAIWPPPALPMPTSLTLPSVIITVSNTLPASPPMVPQRGMPVQWPLMVFRVITKRVSAAAVMSLSRLPLTVLLPSPQKKQQGGRQWVRIVRALHDPADVTQVCAELAALTERPAGTVAVQLDLTGSQLSYAAFQQLEEAIATAEPICALLERRGDIALTPSAEELAALHEQPGLVGSVAQRLHQQMADNQDASAAIIAQQALAQWHQLGARS